MSKLCVLIIKLGVVAPLITDPPPLKLHQQTKYTPSVKWPQLLNLSWNFDALWDLESSDIVYFIFITVWAFGRCKAVVGKGMVT